MLAGRDYLPFGQNRMLVWNTLVFQPQAHTHHQLKVWKCSFRSIPPIQPFCCVKLVITGRQCGDGQFQMSCVRKYFLRACQIPTSFRWRNFQVCASSRVVWRYYVILFVSVRVQELSEWCLVACSSVCRASVLTKYIFKLVRGANIDGKLLDCGGHVRLLTWKHVFVWINSWKKRIRVSCSRKASLVMGFSVLEKECSNIGQWDTLACGCPLFSCTNIQQKVGVIRKWSGFPWGLSQPGSSWYVVPFRFHQAKITRLIHFVTNIFIIEDVYLSRGSHSGSG